MNRSTITIISVLSIILSFFVGACSDKKSEDLKTHIQAEYTTPTKKKKLTSGSKVQYLEIEKNMNQAYVRRLDSIVNSAFDRQLENFEDNELGVVASYKHMFSWLFKSKQSWDDEMNVLSDKYFNNLDVQQEQHALYTAYVTDIKNLRNQFIAANGLPTYTPIDLPTDKISLDSFSNYTRDSIGIETIGQLMGTKIFSWLLGMVITWVIVSLLGFPAGPPGWAISLVVFLISLVVSIILSNRNDSKFLEQIKEQRTESVQFDSNNLLKELDNNTIKFYETL